MWRPAQQPSLKSRPTRVGRHKIDCATEDPPYHLTQASRKGSPRNNDPKTPFGRTRLGSRGFMGKTWDGGDTAFQPEFWTEVLRVLKPGATLLAFGGTRTFHRIICAVEDAGFEIRDCLMWLYGSGFPKSLDISKALDNAAGVERNVIGRRKHPTLRDTNKLEEQANAAHGDNAWAREWDITAPATESARTWAGYGTALKPAWEPIVLAMKPLDGTFAENAQRHGVAGLNVDGSRIGNDDAQGRWPANLLLNEDAGRMLDAQSGITTSGAMKRCVGPYPGKNATGFLRGHFGPNNQHGDFGGASRFFYCAKAGERDRTCEGRVQNNHPTVKPRSLMKYLCRLVTPPGGGLILDPFMGSGSTGIGALLTGNWFVGIELEPESFETARQRIEVVAQTIPQSESLARD